MLRRRVIPCLLLQEGGLVKTRKFRNASYVGDPINTIKLFNDKMCDELMILDIGASRLQKPPDFDLIAEFASEAFMPLSYGGGVRNVEQIERILGLGIEKVVLHSAVMSDLAFMEQAVKRFGSSTIVACLNTRKKWFGGNQVFSCGPKPITPDPVKFAHLLEAAGVGELLLQSVDGDGMMTGYDWATIRDVSSALSIPVVACGGASSFSDIKRLFADTAACAAAAGSLFVYQGPHRAVMISYPRESEIDALSSGK